MDQYKGLEHLFLHPNLQHFLLPGQDRSLTHSPGITFNGHTGCCRLLRRQRPGLFVDAR